MQEAFKNASELAPDRVEFSYRYAESFHDMEDPDWALALKAWEGMEARATRRWSARPCASTKPTSYLHGQARPGAEGPGHGHGPGPRGQKQKLITQIEAGPAK